MCKRTAPNLTEITTSHVPAEFASAPPLMRIPPTCTDADMLAFSGRFTMIVNKRKRNEDVRINFQRGQI